MALGTSVLFRLVPTTRERSRLVNLGVGLVSSLILVLLALTGRRGEGRYVPAVIRTS